MKVLSNLFAVLLGVGIFIASIKLGNALMDNKDIPTYNQMFSHPLRAHQTSNTNPSCVSCDAVPPKVVDRSKEGDMEEYSAQPQPENKEIDLDKLQQEVTDLTKGI